MFEGKRFEQARMFSSAQMACFQLGVAEKRNLYAQTRPENEVAARCFQKIGMVEVPGDFSVGKTKLKRYVLAALDQ